MLHLFIVLLLWKRTVILCMIVVDNERNVYRAFLDFHLIQYNMISIISIIYKYNKYNKF